jgi:hypothetical protein
VSIKTYFEATILPVKNLDALPVFRSELKKRNISFAEVAAQLILEPQFTPKSMPKTTQYNTGQNVLTTKFPHTRLE